MGELSVKIDKFGLEGLALLDSDNWLKMTDILKTYSDVKWIFHFKFIFSKNVFKIIVKDWKTTYFFMWYNGVLFQFVNFYFLSDMYGTSYIYKTS